MANHFLLSEYLCIARTSVIGRPVWQEGIHHQNFPLQVLVIYFLLNFLKPSALLFEILCSWLNLSFFSFQVVGKIYPHLCGTMLLGPSEHVSAGRLSPSNIVWLLVSCILFQKLCRPQNEPPPFLHFLSEYLGFSFPILLLTKSINRPYS